MMVGTVAELEAAYARIGRAINQVGGDVPVAVNA